MANQPMTTLVLGLGGSGAWTVVHVKRQLYDAYNNRVPDNVALVSLDTNNKQRASVGGSEVERREGMGFGRVSLSSSEYAWVGGNVENLIRRVAETKDYPHLDSWLLADRYLREITNRALFELDKGAGMFRQFGRLALFRDVLAPSESRVKAILENKLVGLSRDADADTVAVMIVGSLTGGTGAGLFLDVAHLVRMFAEANNISVRIRGFFYLPRAFASTLDTDKMAKAMPRSFGAMRELRRFLLNEDYKIGYPMHYQKSIGGMSQGWLRGTNQSSLYDFVYLIDGDGDVRMNTVEIERGVAPVIADGIMSYIDHHFGQYQEEYDANIAAGATVAQGNIGKRAFVGTLGSYSYILPVQQMVENWTYQLSRDFVERLIPGARYDEAGRIIGGLATDKNPERKNQEILDNAESYLKNKSGMIRTDGSGQSVKPLGLWEWAWNFYSRRQQKGDRAANDVRTLPLDSWRAMLMPTTIEADPTVRQAVADTESIIGVSIYDVDEAASSDERQNPNADEDWRMIQKASERFMNRQLGTIDSGGGRSGGIYNEALMRFVDLQTERFAEYATIYIQRTLNGTIEKTNDPIAAKTGRLGWLLALFRKLQEVVGEAVSLLEAVRVGRNTQGGDQAARIERAYKSALREMENQAGETKLFGENPYVTAQKAYLGSVDSYITHYRTEFARRAVALAFERILSFIEQSISEMGNWAEILGIHVDSLYNSVREGETRIQGERYRAGRVENHHVIRDDEWEADRYQTYTEDRRARDRLFEAWGWQTQVEKDGRGNPIFQLGASVAETELQADMRGNWAQKNSDAVLNFARQFFRDAVQSESIVSYLRREMFPDDPRGLGNELSKKAGFLLAMDETAIGTRTRVDVLLAQYGDNADDQEFLEKVLGQLSANRGQGDVSDTASPTSRLLRCDDRFRLTLLSSAELVPMSGISAFQSARDIYTQTPYDTRQMYHIFPAEVHAVEYEERLRELGQSPRILSDRVTLLLEDERRFTHFLYLNAHGIIRRAEDTTDSTNTRYLYKLILPEDRRKNNEWYLTMPSTEPSLLKAMVTYVLIGDDARSQQSSSTYTNPIHAREQEILDHLSEVRSQDAEVRTNADNLALNDPELREWIEAFMAPIDEETGEELWDELTQDEIDEFYDISETVVRHDILQEMEIYMKERLPTLAADIKRVDSEQLSGSDRHDVRERRQENYDLFSVCILLLRNEMDVLRQRVEREYKRLVGDVTM